MSTDRDTLFIMAFGGVLLAAVAAGVLYYLLSVRPMLRRLQEDRAHVEVLARKLNFHTTELYKRTFAYGEYQGQQYVFWGPHVRASGFSSTHELIIAMKTTTPGKSHVVTMFGADLAKKVFGDKGAFTEVTMTIPADSAEKDVVAAMTQLAGE